MSPGSLGGPWDSPRAPLGGPWEVHGRPCPSPGLSWEASGSSWRVPGRRWGSLGIRQFPPRTPWEPSLDSSVGGMGALKSNEKPLVFNTFSALGGPWGDPGGPWEVPGGSLGVPGRPSDVPELIRVVPGGRCFCHRPLCHLYTGNVPFLWSPLRLRVSLTKLRRLRYRVVLGPLQTL